MDYTNFRQTLNQSKAISQPVNDSIQNIRMITTFLAFLILEVSFIFIEIGFYAMRYLLYSLEVYFNPEVEEEVRHVIPKRGPGR